MATPSTIANARLLIRDAAPPEDDAARHVVQLAVDLRHGLAELEVGISRVLINLGSPATTRTRRPSETMPALNVAVPPLPSVSKQSLSLKPKHANFRTNCVSARPVAASAVLARARARLAGAAGGPAKAVHAAQAKGRPRI